MLPSIVVTDKRAYQQLKSEALVSLKLVHPNIVTLRAFEENNGAPFLVMDYIEGQTLSDYLAVKGKLSEAETVKLLKPIAAALDYAHGEKVIHRDVKPSNIIIRNDGHPFILDFGIAREIQESMTRVTGRTISGTLLYMSPEQLRGAPPAPAQDVYSFASMCYECLKGEPPFTRGDIVYQIINEKPVKLFSETPITKYVMCGLAKNPHDRPSKCTSVLDVDSTIGYAMPATFLARKTTKFVWLMAALLGIVVTGVVWWSGAQQSEVQAPQELKKVTVAERTPLGGADTNSFPSSETCINTVDTKHKVDESENASEFHVEVIHQDEGKGLLLSELRSYKDRHEKVTPSQEQTVVTLNTTNRSEVVSPTGSVGITPSNEYEKTKDILSGIESSLLEYRRITKALPSSLQELQIHIRIPSLFDAWGTEIYYETDGIDYALQSAGPDRDFEADSDNIVIVCKKSLKNPTKAGDTWSITLLDGVKMNFKWCPAGRFFMGSPNSEEGREIDEMLHEVVITNGFWIGETEVSREQWTSIMDSETGSKGGNGNMRLKNLTSTTDEVLKRLKVESKPRHCESKFWTRLMIKPDLDYVDYRSCDSKFPVCKINWFEANIFCQRLTYLERNVGHINGDWEFRLPTEIEWEYACRAGSRGAFSFGNMALDLNYDADYKVREQYYNDVRERKKKIPPGLSLGEAARYVYGDFHLGYGMAQRVDSHTPNLWGIYNMHGNVSEWCADSYNSWIRDKKLAAKFPSSNSRVFRGGSFYDPLRRCRSAFRDAERPDVRFPNIGFRVVLAQGSNIIDSPKQDD